jgi:hypothetical protein
MPIDYSGNPTAALLPLFRALARLGQRAQAEPWLTCLPLSSYNALEIKLAAERSRAADSPARRAQDS